ncbi:unnamed protein product [Anisakis simplex]|uniref:Cadherin domain-containing protein n=1 Tax=Anisakis simplex TaxID=6269 RepID=A0A0M3K564_ANISI|nr:unnamed protein product [Anisakis simplex]
MGFPMLKVTAQNALLPEKVASRLLRIQIKDLDDNQPSFGEIDGSLRRVFTVDNDQNREHLDNIGTVHADDPDGAPFNSIYYYLLPSCSNRDGKFSIDERSGMVQVNNYEALQSAEYHLCALASAYQQSAPPEIAFDNRNESMLAFTVEVTPLKMAQLFRVQSAIRFDNNTITTFGENIYTPIPITMDRSDPSSSNLEYVLDSVAFIPSETSSQSMAAETSQPSEANEYFVVDPETANVYIDPSLMHHDEGVFKLRINVIQSTMNTSMARLYKQVRGFVLVELIQI